MISISYLCQKWQNRTFYETIKFAICSFSIVNRQFLIPTVYQRIISANASIRVVS